MSSARIVRTIAAASTLAVTGALVSQGGSAWADGPLAPKSSFNMVVDPYTGLTNTPTDGESVPNIDSVKSTIRAYYNATGGLADPNSSRYISQVHAIEQQLLHALPANPGPNAAVVFDVDDTLLWTYNYTDHTSNFNYDPVTNQNAVLAGFPAVPGMPALLRTLDDRGYHIYGVTGRPGAGNPAAVPDGPTGDQTPATLANLEDAGFVDDSDTPLFDASNLYTKGLVTVTGGVASVTGAAYVDCTLDGTAGACSTVEVKAQTRQHIEGGGDDIVMNVGDQWSDLMGGFADDATKIPNPTYFLASPDIPGAPASDALMVPPTSYVMQPDGSSGYSIASGDDIPNADPARKYIRAYYNAPNTGTPAQIGIADKVSSPYITQMNSLTATWTSAVTSDCTSATQAHNAGVASKAAAAAAVDAAQAQVAKDTKAVAKAKKKLKKAHSPQAKRKARKKLKKAEKALKASQATLDAAQDKLDGITVPPAAAAVFDADDTTLWNYDLEDNDMKFNFNPAKQQVWITEHKMPAVPGMLALVKAAASSGCAIFGLTGRPLSQQADTIGNLTDKGYIDGSGNPLFTAARFFTKGTIPPGPNASIPTQPWVDCNQDGNRANCSTIEYKSDTRGHIEDLGFDIVGNFGDQFSDLIGGHADHTYKVPNPTYYLP